jgi:uncharacterized protein (TIGR03067 family)
MRFVAAPVVVFVVALAGDGFAQSTTSGDATNIAAVTLRPADADGDDKITRTEWNVFTQAFHRLDANKNETIDLAELLPPNDAATGSPLILGAFDADGDRNLSRAEWGRMTRAFAGLDVDGSRTLTANEFQTAIEALKEARKPGGASSSTPGLWRGHIVDGRGQNPNSGTPIELLISGNRIAGRELHGQADSTPNLGIGTFVMTGSTKSGFFDAQYTDGPQAGQICLGIFRMEGDTLYWCASNRAGYRPDEFATGSGCWLMILRRVETK